VNWNDVVATAHTRLLGIQSPIELNPLVLIKTSLNWDTLYLAFIDMEAQKNNHKLNLLGIPDALHMMIHIKLFIPLSMLTTLSISHIWYNDNLKFKKIPFSYAAGKYALDNVHIPSE